MQENLLKYQNFQYFKEELFCETICLPFDSPEIETILDISKKAEIENYKLVDTPIGLSNENQYLSGKKLLVHCKVHGVVQYVAKIDCQSVYAFPFQFIKSIFVVVPSYLNDRSICEYIGSKKMKITPYIEENIYQKLDERSIYVCTLLFVNVMF